MTDVASLVSVYISLLTDVVSPVSVYISLLMTSKIISGFELVNSCCDTIIANSELFVSRLAIILKGLSTDLRMVGVGTNKNSLPLGLASCAVLTPGERVTYFTNNAMSLSVATAE